MGHAGGHAGGQFSSQKMVLTRTPAEGGSLHDLKSTGCSSDRGCGWGAGGVGWVGWWWWWGGWWGGGGWVVGGGGRPGRGRRSWGVGECRGKCLGVRKRQRGSSATRGITAVAPPATAAATAAAGTQQLTPALPQAQAEQHERQSSRSGRAAGAAVSGRQQAERGAQN